MGRFFDRFIDTLQRSGVPAALRAVGVTDADLAAIFAGIAAERARPPRLVLIGETGVGKTSTINALFNKGKPLAELEETSHERACTKVIKEIRGSIGEPVVIVDMPGIGEDIDEDERILGMYREEIPNADAVVWVLKADNRAATNIQRCLRQLIDEGVLDPRRLVIALNQVDALQPGEWDREINRPSPEQERTIIGRQRDARERYAKITGLALDRIVGYSAKQFYNLEALCHALAEAADRRRACLILDRADCASFTQLVDMGEDMPLAAEGR